MQLLDNFFSVETTQVLFLLANWEKNYFWLWGQSHPSFCNRVTSAKISISWILKEHKQIYTLYFFQKVSNCSARLFPVQVLQHSPCPPPTLLNFQSKFSKSYTELYCFPCLSSNVAVAFTFRIFLYSFYNVIYYLF